MAPGPQYELQWACYSLQAWSHQILINRANINNIQTLILVILKPGVLKCKLGPFSCSEKTHLGFYLSSSTFDPRDEESRGPTRLHGAPEVRGGRCPYSGFRVVQRREEVRVKNNPKMIKGLGVISCLCVVDVFTRHTLSCIMTQIVLDLR